MRFQHLEFSNPQKVNDNTIIVNLFSEDYKGLYGMFIITNGKFHFYRESTCKPRENEEHLLEQLQEYIGSQLGFIQAKTHFQADISYKVTKFNEKGEIEEQEHKATQTF